MKKTPEQRKAKHERLKKELAVSLERIANAAKKAKDNAQNRIKNDARK